MLTDLAIDITAAATVDVSMLSTPERTAHIARLRRLHNRWCASQLTLLADFEASGAWSVDTAHGAANWLTTNTGTSKADAAHTVRLAVRLASMPLVAAAFSAGDITQAHVAVFARAVANVRIREAFADQEARFVDEARTMNADQLDQLVRRWVNYLDQDGPAPIDPDHDEVHASIVGDRVRIRGDLSLETGVPVMAALAEHADALFRRDRTLAEADLTDPCASRPASARRAQALAELIAAGASADANTRHREPLFTVHVDAETLASGRLHAESIHELDDGTVIPMTTLQTWACGALVHRVLFGAAGEVLDVGRAARYASPAQRRGLAARDRGCAVPGCDRTPAHCDAHHVRHWEDGGTTSIDNLALLCRHHHRSIHAGHLTVAIIDGTTEFHDRFGRLVTGRRRRPEVDAA